MKREINIVLLWLAQKLVDIIAFAADLLMHPIKNITIWVSVLLYIGITYSTYSIKVEGKRMLEISLGLLAIVTFITNYLNNQVIDMKDTGDFYLGVNEKKYFVHRSFFLQVFKNARIRFFFWSIAILPLMIMVSKLEFGDHVFEKSDSNVLLSLIDSGLINGLQLMCKYEQTIRNLWGSLFVVTALVCVGVLIEVVKLSRISFASNYWYHKSDYYARRCIERDLKRSARHIIRSLFDIRSSLSYFTCETLQNQTGFDAKSVIGDLLMRVSSVLEERSEKNKYVSTVFEGERSVISNLVDDLKGKCLFRKTRFKMLCNYYTDKWNYIYYSDYQSIPAKSLIETAREDLAILLYVAESFADNPDYERAFYGRFYENNLLFFDETRKSCNKAISIILNVLHDRCLRHEFIEDLQSECISKESMDSVIRTLMSLLYRIKEVDEKGIVVLSGREAFSTVFTSLAISLKNELELEKKIKKTLLESGSESIINKEIKRLGLNWTANDSD